MFNVLTSAIYASITPRIYFSPNWWEQLWYCPSNFRQEIQCNFETGRVRYWALSVEPVYLPSDYQLKVYNQTNPDPCMHMRNGFTHTSCQLHQPSGHHNIARNGSLHAWFSIYQIRLHISRRTVCKITNNMIILTENQLMIWFSASRAHMYKLY